MSADPVLTLLPGAFFALLFGIAAMHKIGAWRLFEQQVADYRVLPRPLTRVAAVLLPAVEAAVAASWLDARTRPAAAAASALLLALYGASMAWNLRQGRDTVDCGCGAPDGAQVIRWALVGRNAALATLAAALGLLAASNDAPMRAMSWVDWFTVNAGAIALMGVYTAFNQTLANLPPQRVLD
ncbi:MauE/DoxX family redox-associated membrane protein [Massilia sp. METH4]|uniref:MauE/DoxX family redox-associated membrane protein n=1 Tax=Massilia sp. METH4 TaxID=3123041 RepID=UPI0030D42045